MSNRGAGVAGSVVSLEPKANVRSEASDQLDKAGQTILGLLNRAASAAEANYQQAIEVTDKLSAQLRAAEDRIRELEAKVRYHQDKADRDERWLYQISVEIERNFFGRDDTRSSQPPAAARRDRPFRTRHRPFLVSQDACRSEGSRAVINLSEN
jgi:hypothetical protein